MKLSSKLKIAFCVLALVPLFLLSVAFFSLTSIQLRQYTAIADNAGTTIYELLSNPVGLISNLCDKGYTSLIESAENEPDRFSDIEYLDSVNAILKENYAYLVIYQDGKYTYLGSDNAEYILDKLENIHYSGNRDEGTYLGGEENILVNAVQFSSESVEDGKAFIVMQIELFAPKVKNYLLSVVILIVLILILTSAVFSVWISRETLTPINKLRLATYNIKNGNLDFEIDTTGKDEVSELCRDFDSMRLQLKQNAEEKIVADKENKELISNISHDLKTPITAIKGYVEGIMDGVADNPEKIDKYIRTIYNKACDMDKLIDELTFYSKIDTNRVMYNFVKVNISDYFEDCIEELKIDLDASGIELNYANNIPSDTVLVADVEQLKRVINNIISNSVKYMDKEHAEIAIILKDMGSKIEIVMKDNGKGISPEALPHIFDRLYRADASRNSAVGGSGIGLSIVKKIILDHNGTITAESVVGQGTTMHICLNKFYETEPETKKLNN